MNTASPANLNENHSIHSSDDLPHGSGVGAGMVTAASSSSSANRKRKHIDWGRVREEELVNLVIKHKAHKKTNNITMEEKWSRIAHELFNLESFKDCVGVDGYTLQKKFSRLKKKVAAKFEIYNGAVGFDCNNLPKYSDNLDHLIAKLVVEELAEKQSSSSSSAPNNNSSSNSNIINDNETNGKQRDDSRKINFRREMDEIVEELGHSSGNRDEHSLVSAADDVESAEDSRIIDITDHSYDVTSIQPRKRVRLTKQPDSDSEDEGNAEEIIMVGTIPSSNDPSNISNPMRLERDPSTTTDAEREFIQSLRNQDILSDHTMGSFGAFYSSNKSGKFDADFEKEKERRRLSHLERMEMMKMEYVMKQNLLKLQNEAKQVEAQIKLAEAHKAQAEATQALLKELQRLKKDQSQSIEDS